MLTVGLDIGSTTVKAAAVVDGKVLWRDYKRHNTKQAEMVLEFLVRLRDDCGLQAGRDRVFVTGSGAAPFGRGRRAKRATRIAATSVCRMPSPASSSNVPLSVSDNIMAV